MPRKSKNLESPIASISFKKRVSKKDEEASKSNSAIVLAKSIESFDVIYDGNESLCVDSKVTFDSAILPDLKISGFGDDEGTKDSFDFIGKRKFSNDNFLMDDDDGSTKDNDVWKDEDEKISKKDSSSHKENANSSVSGTFEMIENPFIYDDLNDKKEDTINQLTSIVSPKKESILHVDTFFKEDSMTCYKSTPSTNYVTPKSSEFTESNFLIENKLLKVIKSDEEDDTATENIHYYNNTKIEIPRPTKAHKFDHNATTPKNSNSVIFNQSLLNDNSFESIMSSILPALSKLDPKNQATILNVILEELSNRKQLPKEEDNLDIPDFLYAQEQRRIKYNNNYSWGLSGLYEYLDGVGTDLKWAMEATNKRKNNEPYLPWSYYDIKSQQKTHPPILTCLLLIAHTITLITSYGLNNWNIELLDINPMLGPSTKVLLQMGAKESTLITTYNQWYRLFLTSMFLNAGMIQYCINLMILAFTTSALERFYGFGLTLMFYMIPAIGGTAFSAIFMSQYVTVSSNAAICAMLGVCLSIIFTFRSFLFQKKVRSSTSSSSMLDNTALYWKYVRNTLVLIAFLVVQFALGLVPFIDNVTNITGFIYGVLLGLSTSYYRFMNGIYTISPSTSRIRKVWFYTKKYFFGIVSCISLISSIIILATMDINNICSNTSTCQYLGCVELPLRSDTKWYYCDNCAYALVYPTRNETIGLYTHISLQCPNQQYYQETGFQGNSSNLMIDVNITSYGLNNVQDLELQVPMFCRQYCEF